MSNFTTSTTSPSSLVEGVIADAYAVQRAVENVRDAAVFMPSQVSVARNLRDVYVASLRNGLADADVLAAVGVERAEALRVAAMTGSFDAVEAVAVELRG